MYFLYKHICVVHGFDRNVSVLLHTVLGAAACVGGGNVCGVRDAAQYVFSDRKSIPLEEFNVYCVCVCVVVGISYLSYNFK